MKKDFFTKNLSFPNFFEINTSNFPEMFLAVFRKFSWKIFFKCQNEKQNNFFLFFVLKFYFLVFLNFVPTEFSKYCKERFIKV